jgi:galactokinase
MESQAIDSFVRIYGSTPDVLVSSPGRVNIIGEHTDYMGGLCLPMAINLALFVAGARCISASDSKGNRNTVTISSSLYPEFPPQKIDSRTSERYRRLSSLIKALIESGHEFPSVEIDVTGDLPVGAGLSSSAAFTMGVLTLLNELNEWQLDDNTKIKLCLKAEHNAGTPCGLMDPSAILYGQQGCATYLDCYNEENEQVKIETPGYSWLLVSSGVRRDLSDGRYANLRNRMECAALALKELDSRIEHPRFLDLAAYMSGRSSIPESHMAYLDHYYIENERVKTFIGAIGLGNVMQAGNLLFDAQSSLVNNLHTNIDATDWIVDRLGTDGRCIGARVTGAGFGGAVISLVESESAGEIGDGIASLGSRKFGLNMQFWIVEPDSGVRVIEFDKHFTY